VRLAAGLWIERTGTRLHASWGRGLKSPTFFENFDNSYYDLGGGPIYTVGNPDLDPERVTSLDAGVEQRLLGDKLVAGVTVFRNRFRDFIDYRYVSPTLTTYTNAGKALTQGAECELALKPAAWARARGSLTLTHSEAITDQSSVTFSDGQQLIRRPKRVAGAAAEAEPFAPWKAAPAWTRKLTVFVEVLRQAGSVDVDWNTYRRVDLPDWTATNVGLNWEVCKGLRLFGRYENIFDQRIEQVSGITGDKSRFLGGAGYTLAF
jgi:vitamin B12 transporter